MDTNTSLIILLIAAAINIPFFPKLKNILAFAFVLAVAAAIIIKEIIY